MRNVKQKFRCGQYVSFIGKYYWLVLGTNKDGMVKIVSPHGEELMIHENRLSQ